MLALDLGTDTGWAVTVGSGNIKSGTQTFASNNRTEGAGMRFLRFNQWLSTMLNLCAFERVAFEEIKQRQQSVAAANMYGGMRACLTAWCEQQKIPYEGVLPGEIKKHATGKGNASKEEMIRAMRAKRGHTELKDNADNEADALALLYYVIENAAPSPAHLRPSFDGQPAARIPVEAVRPPRRPVTGRGR